MSTFALLLTTLGGIVVLLATAAAVVAFLRVNLAKTTIETQRDSIIAFETRVAQLESDNTRHAARLASVEAENAMLRSIVTGVDELKILRAEITNHQDEVKRTHDQILTGLYAMHDLMIEFLKRAPLRPVE